MPFEIQKAPIDGLVILKPAVFKDARGYFKETYQKKDLYNAGIQEDFVQDNLSFSQYKALRGLHFQCPPHGQGKLVSVLLGTVKDVVVDIRKSSPTYGKYFEIILSDENHYLFYIPPGFAHGFVVLSPQCIFSYKCTNYFNKSSEGGLLWNDPNLNINWEIEEPIISEKDTVYPTFESFTSPFE
ncbi:MAG: dTDP-4-dehydrorhamnose 3,5-epimerase [Bacteroidia bacterium]|nr:dTDP-4-dehydrorhamnose 3,5-epimerase [Bacteroidia bacterium]